jgi:transposase
MVEAEEVAAVGRSAEARGRERVAEPGCDDQSRASALRRRKRGASSNAIGRSRGGPSTKVHLIVDSKGLPIDFELTEGQRHESIGALPLIKRIRRRCVIADRGFDTDPFREVLFQQNCYAVIPSHPNRKRPIAYDDVLYRERNLIERTFAHLKQARRFATRYEKTLRNYAGVVAICCAIRWLRF